MIFGCSTPPEENVIKSATFQFNYNVEFTKSGYVKAWIPIPQTTRNQKILNLTIDTDLNMYMAKDVLYGNTFIIIDGQVVAPQSVDITTMFTRYETKSYYDQTNARQLELYLAEMDLVPRDERFEKINNSLSGNGLQFGHDLYTYVLEHMTYDKSGEGWGQGDAIYACDIAKGNCTDYHSLFNAVARTHGIPARFNIGFSIPEGKEGHIKGYHCWTEFYVADNGWIPVDISEADKHIEKTDYYFGNLDERRLMLTVGRDIRLPSGSPYDVVNYIVYPYVKLDGKVSDSFRTSFSYKEVEIDKEDQ